MYLYLNIFVHFLKTLDKHFFKTNSTIWNEHLNQLPSLYFYIYFFNFFISFYNLANFKEMQGWIVKFHAFTHGIM